MSDLTLQQQDTGLSLREKLFWSVLGVAGIGGTIYFGRKWIVSMRSNTAEQKTLTDGAPEAYAKRIKMAFENDGWWGTDIVALRETMRQIPSQQVFDEVQQKYALLYDSSMLRDMSGELSLSEYNEMMQIKAGKPAKLAKGAKAPLNYTSLARRLKAAFDKTYGFIPGTDIEAIKSVFTEVPTQTAFIKVGTEYFKEYGKHLPDALKGELGSTGYFNMMKLITSKPKA